jgi:hypothetical protein
MVVLDFFSGSHGHFLEYVINTYIYRGPRVKNIFTELGTCHGIRQDTAYQQHQVVTAGHYSEFNRDPVRPPQQVIRITIDSDMENICYQLNVLCRAGDIPEDKKAQEINSDVRNSPAQFRMDYYFKFLSDRHGYKRPNHWRWNDIDHYEFPMRSLYNALDFYSELQKLSQFLNYSFEPDPSLLQLWQDFCDKNHGLCAWTRCNEIYQQVMANKNIHIKTTVAEQAILNWMLTRAVNIHDGALFDSDYPSNTADIWKCVEQHLKTFDGRF